MADIQWDNDGAILTTLNGGINDSVGSLTVSAAPTGRFANPDYYIGVDTGANFEIMLVTAVSTTTLTVTRGREGTSGVAHSTGVTVRAIDVKDSRDRMLLEYVQHGTMANRPASRDRGRLYLPTDGPFLCHDDGSAISSWFMGVHCTPPVLGDFTQVNVGGNAVVDDSRGGIRLLSDDASGHNAALLVKSVTPPVTVTVGLLLLSGAVQYAGAGICVRASGGNAFIQFLGLTVGAGLPPFWDVIRMTSPTAAGSDIGQGPCYQFAAFPLWLRIVQPTSGNRQFLWSRDKIKFHQLVTVAYNDSFTTNQVGLVADSYLSSTQGGAWFFDYTES